MLILILGLVIFIGLHLAIYWAPSLREGLKTRLGVGAYRGVFSLISTLGLGLIFLGFSRARLDPVIVYVAPTWLRHLMLALMIPVFPLLIATYLQGHIKYRVKHPMLAALKLWAAGHLLVNGTLADLALFGSFLAWGVMARIAIKKRGEQPASFVPKTSHDIIALAVGLILYALVVAQLHLWLFGVSPLPMRS